MNSSIFSRHRFAILICLSAFTGWTPVNSGGTQEQGTAEKPSAEMNRLQKLYLGVWDYTENYPKTPFYPQGGTDTGVYSSELGPGGNSILNRFHSRGPVGDFDGLLVMTWEPRESAYESYVFGNEFPGCVIQTGRFEGDALVLRSEFTAEGMKLRLRNVTRLAAPGKIVSEEYLTKEGSPEILMVRVEAKKRP